MKSKKRIFLSLVVLLFQQVLMSQDKLNIQFGKITPADFDLSRQIFDSGANAVIIADIGKTSFEGNKKAGMTMIFTHFMRVKILNKNGFDIADKQIRLYSSRDGDEETLSDLKASTFNLENGVIVETKLDQKSVFTGRDSKHWDSKKFTMPALREGSIFDITYTVKSDFYENLSPWNFQGSYPRLWSEYETTIPPVFHYTSRIQGDGRFDISTHKEVFEHFSIVRNNKTEADDFIDLSGNSIQQRWVKKNVPALREEPFTTTVGNYISRISFQLNYYQWTKEDERHDIATTWFVQSEKMMNDEDFGMKLNQDNTWMNGDVTVNTNNCKTDEEKIKRIYSFIRNNFSCTDHGSIYAHSSLKEVYKKKSGSGAEINLLLTAMLRQAQITADPVILSTRGNGIANQTYPMMEDFNYVICVAYAGNNSYHLDASIPDIGFNHLISDCYNGEARIINKEKPYILDLSADSLRESKLTRVFISSDEKGIPAGNFETVLGNEESHALRSELKKSSQKDYFKKIQTSYSIDMDMGDMGIDSLTQYDYPLTVHYDFDLKNLIAGDVVYFNPMLSELYKNNPFKSLERHYPVEMPYKTDELYVLNMEIPKGYGVDEIPKSAKVSLNGTDGFFEYLIQKNESVIQMRVHLKLNKAYFPVEDYPVLRDFFAYVVKKENEQIVFKKIP